MRRLLVSDVAVLRIRAEGKSSLAGQDRYVGREQMIVDRDTIMALCDLAQKALMSRGPR